MGISQEELKRTMREQELKRRTARTKIMFNHTKLADDMTDQEKLEFRERVAPDPRGYWKKLWDSIRGK